MTALTIWLIGYLYTLGIERRICDEIDEQLEVMDAAKLFFFWPCYLGQSGLFQNIPEVIDEAKADDLPIMAAGIIEQLGEDFACKLIKELELQL